MKDALTDDKRAELAMHENVMDVDTAGLLFKISGIAALAREATIELRLDQPIPEGVSEAIGVIHDLAQSALERAGCV